MALSMEGTYTDSLGNIIVGLVAAGVFYILFERPIMNMEELIFPELTF